MQKISIKPNGNKQNKIYERNIIKTWVMWNLFGIYTGVSVLVCYIVEFLSPKSEPRVSKHTVYQHTSLLHQQGPNVGFSSLMPPNGTMTAKCQILKYALFRKLQVTYWWFCHRQNNIEGEKRGKWCCNYMERKRKRKRAKQIWQHMKHKYIE